MNRRKFLITTGLGGLAAAWPGRLLADRGGGEPPLSRPNIVWISAEDISPDLGCYGDAYAVTPALDRLAGEGVRFESAFANAGVCAPARSCIITGMYPTSIGTNPMRCQGVPPAPVKCFTEYLRAAGYFCTNRSKTDYQFGVPSTAWDECGNKAHWRNRAPGQSFFSVINFTTTHESRIRSSNPGLLRKLDSLRPGERHDPVGADLPPYYPDTPAVRQDWARYADLITLMDKEVGGILRQLDEDGLADDTIVCFFGDHGRGLPRAKRWIYDSGLRVPLIVRVPEKYRRLAGGNASDAAAPGSVRHDLVSFVDFAPTMLALAGVDEPSYFQGQAFLGRGKAPPRQHIFAARDRMDEAFDLIRAVRDDRWKYIRNFMPHLPRSQDIEYMNEMPTMKEMRRLHAEGKLAGAERQYFEDAKPVEELYDLAVDPHEVRNLAGDPAHEGTLRRLRERLLSWMRDIGDVGMIPEPDFEALKRPDGRWARTGDPRFTLEEREGSDDGTIVLSISSPTPGASIAWKGADQVKGGWKLYRAPIRLKMTQAILARACRPGFRDSAAVRFEGGAAEPSGKDKRTGDTDSIHWRDRIASGLLDRLLAFKEIDLESGAAAKERIFPALEDRDGPVRYWAVVALHHRVKGTPRAERAAKAIAALLDDSSPSVSIAAAEALCDLGEEMKGLPVLQKKLEHRDEMVRLFAAASLGRIGDKVRSAMPAIEAGLKDSSKYVSRTCRNIIKRLERP